MNIEASPDTGMNIGGSFESLSSPVATIDPIPSDLGKSSSVPLPTFSSENFLTKVISISNNALDGEPPLPVRSGTPKYVSLYERKDDPRFSPIQESHVSPLTDPAQFAPVEPKPVFEDRRVTDFSWSEFAVVAQAKSVEDTSPVVSEYEETDIDSSYPFEVEGEEDKDMDQQDVIVDPLAEETTEIHQEQSLISPAETLVDDVVQTGETIHPVGTDIITNPETDTFEAEESLEEHDAVQSIEDMQLDQIRDELAVIEHEQTSQAPSESRLNGEENVTEEETGVGQDEKIFVHDTITNQYRVKEIIRTYEDIAPEDSAVPGAHIADELRDLKYDIFAKSEPLQKAFLRDGSIQPTLDDLKKITEIKPDEVVDAANLVVEDNTAVTSDDVSQIAEQATDSEVDKVFRPQVIFE